ncbi:MAG TPA: glycerol-3-phosphate 1-O-acyltransferase PlsY [Brevundimonas sp.]|jgi:glycerol-3-phosphate acyltransferase PlsY|uniref:glycerol-3-phosphate 1-O-acyltransferase PlsY n=1 Tax=Brevundimonas sp. TaxID=1871086 RepID=UPI002CD49294|nr:glycerol-3-phosphate 1-O-acyltransferase PlsY [Brevundimonas sp.]HRH19196.1 glycerol-3-phosphate 1-O-acyltransferase PlsY [Brevundimonas sp.]
MADLGDLTSLASILTAALSYLLGSIPFGLLVTRLGGAGDVRSIGSGNIGATNVLRTGRKELALATLVLDAGKGAVAVLVARQLFDNEALTALAGASAFLGHLFPVWLRFKGGKGVATFYGVLLAAAWPVGLVSAAAWILVFALTRISSLSALLAASVAVPVAWLMGQPMPVIGLTAFMAALVLVRHHENIGRLLRGQEPRFGSGR